MSEKNSTSSLLEGVQSAPHLWRSDALGEMREIQVCGSRLQYFRRGDGPPLVFAHGWLSNANLWRKVVDALSDRYACYVLDLPLGAHRVPMDPAADLTPMGCGLLIAAALDEIDLKDVTLVGNDSGGAYSQIAVAHHTERVRRLVLNSCETPYSEFPPPPFDGLPGVAKDPAALGQLFEALRDPEVRTSAVAYGSLMKHPVEAIVSDSYALPCVSDERILYDTSKAMSTASTAPVHQAGERLIAEFTRPVLLAWGPEDPVFDIADARRYAEALAGGSLVAIDDAYSFTPEDQPLRLAEEIARFAV